MKRKDAFKHFHTLAHANQDTFFQLRLAYFSQRKGGKFKLMHQSFVFVMLLKFSIFEFLSMFFKSPFLFLM